MNKKIHPFIGIVAISAVIIIALAIFASQSCFNYYPSVVNITQKTKKTENKYQDNNAGFSLTYPSTINLGEPLEDKLTLTIKSEKIENLDYPLGFDKATAQNDSEAMALGQYGKEGVGCAFSQSEQVMKIGSASNYRYAKSYASFVCLEVCDVKFNRSLIFYNNGYQTVITLTGEKDKIIASLPEYFKKDPTNCGDYQIWNVDLMNQFYQTLINHQGSAVAQKWYDTFDEIVKSIKFTTVEDLCQTGADCQQVCGSCYNKQWLDNNPEITKNEACPYPPNFNKCACINNQCRGDYEKPEITDNCIDKNSNNSLTLTEAMGIAENSDCSIQGDLSDKAFCNDYTGTWWIDLTVDNKPMCNPTCVINVNTKQAEINWRCGGLLPE